MKAFTVSRAMLNALAATAVLSAAPSAISAPPNANALDKGTQIMVGGVAMDPSKSVVENVAKANNLTTFVSLVQKAGLEGQLRGNGPFTVFAPTNDAFASLPTATLTDLQKPTNKKLLVSILSGHIAQGNLDAKALTSDLNIGKKKDGELATIGGSKLSLIKSGDGLRIKSSSGSTARVETADVKMSNGVVHVIDKVLLPAPLSN